MAPSGRTYTALQYRNFSDVRSKVGFFNFFEDGIDPNTGERNFVQDDGSGSCPEEPTIRMCGDLELGLYEVYVRTIYFCDEDGSGDLSCGDTHLVLGNYVHKYFELTNDPIIYKLNPRRTERYFVEDCSPPGLGPEDKWHLNQVKIYGYNFGPQRDGGKVCIGRRAHYYASNCVRELLVRTWSNTLIRVRPQLPSYYQGVTRCVWVEKGGVKSNYKLIKILNDSTLCP